MRARLLLKTPVALMEEQRRVVFEARA